MAHDFDKAPEEFSSSSAAAGTKSNGAAAPRNPLSRAGSEQLVSPTQPRSLVGRQDSRSSVQSLQTPPLSPTQPRNFFGRQDSQTSVTSPQTPPFSPTQPRNLFGRHDSQTSVTSPLTLPPDPIPENPFHLADFFSDHGEPRLAYSDLEIHEISRCLKFADQHEWSDAPRLYTLLRTIGQIPVLDILLDEGINDLLFPFTPTTVPKILSHDSRLRFLNAQELVLTKAVDLETGSKRHTHFGKDDAFPFIIRGKLGRGGCANVDKIYNPLSKREFARKRFRRGRGQSKGEIDNFKNELQVLKKIQHDHCIKLVASYTDSKYFGLIMSPIADCNLAEYFAQISDDPEQLGILRKFYGCLASSLRYLHESRIRHRDIKPENILVKNDRVYLTDFGIALDWESLGRSTTTDDAGKTWIYCAPEVAQYEKRNLSSDIWSLGCVFLEMTTVLKGHRITDMQEFFKGLHGSYRFYKCKSGIAQWANGLRASGLASDNLPLKWTGWMLRIESKSRPSAEDVYQEITSQVQRTEDDAQRFIGDCCIDCCVVDSDSDSDAESDPDAVNWVESHGTKQKPAGAARVEGPGLEPEYTVSQNDTVETRLSLPRITMDQEAMVDDLKIDIVGPDDTAGDAKNLAAGMTAALVASRSRRTSAASDMPRPTSSGVVNDFSDNAQSLKGWQTIGLVNNLPVLGPRSWAQPSTFMNNVKSDRSFMTYLQSKYKDCYDVVSMSTPEDVTLLVEMLLRNGLKLDAWVHIDEEGISPLFRVLDWGESYQSLFKIMVNSGANLNYETTTDCRNPLSEAAGKGYIWAIKILVDAGADLQKHTRRIGLVDAAENNHLGTIKYLINALKVEPDLKGTDGRTALRAASINGHVEIMNFLLETCRDKIDIENRVNDQSVLYDACVGGRTEVVKILLDYGADPNATSGVKTGKWTPLIKAVQASNIEMVQLLIDRDAKISANTLPIVSGAGPLGTNAMNEAKKCGNAKIIRLLSDERKTRAIVKRYQSVKKKKKNGAPPRVEVESEEE